MQPCSEIIEFLKSFAPLDLAEDWDNVGLLIGKQSHNVQRVMTCLTLTPDVAAEAIDEQIELIVTHHPIMFRARKQITDESVEGKMLIDLIENRIAVYSPHTAFDSAEQGINQQWCDQLKLQKVEPLRLIVSNDQLTNSGSGRVGNLRHEFSLHALMLQVKDIFQIDHLAYVGQRDMNVSRVAVACGAASEYLEDAIKKDCQVLITGEARFHSCLEARHAGIGMLITGHYRSERFACERLATLIGEAFPDLTCSASIAERDPIGWL